MFQGELNAVGREGTDVRALLQFRLLDRWAEIEETTLARVQAITASEPATGVSCTAGLRSAVAAALGYGLKSIGSTERNRPRIPANLLVQARLAARSGVSLDTILRRYFAGYALFDDFILGAADCEEVDRVELSRVLRGQAAQFDLLLAAVSEEHGREFRRRPETAEERRVDQVRRLLAGERFDAADLAYDFDAAHVGLIVCGPESSQTVRSLGGSVDRRLLSVFVGENVTWAWLGGRRKFEDEELEHLNSVDHPADTRIAAGEPAQGYDGWRLTHRQAQAAFRVAQRGPDRCARYGSVALLASALRDDVLMTSLRRNFLEPLTSERDAGAVAKQTLRAYFEAGGNISSAAAALGIKRHTVTNRLRAIEERVGRTLTSCSLEMDLALRLDGLSESSQPTIAEVDAS